MHICTVLNTTYRQFYNLPRIRRFEAGVCKVIKEQDEALFDFVDWALRALRLHMCGGCARVPGQKKNLSAGYTCRTSAESELLWHLGRYMHSEVSKDHVWHSDDARELGHPTSKTMFLSTQPAERADRLRVDLTRRAHSARLSFVHTER